MATVLQRGQEQVQALGLVRERALELVLVLVRARALGVERATARAWGRGPGRAQTRRVSPVTAPVLVVEPRRPMRTAMQSRLGRNLVVRALALARAREQARRPRPVRYPRRPCAVAARSSQEPWPWVTTEGCVAVVGGASASASARLRRVFR